MTINEVNVCSELSRKKNELNTYSFIANTRLKILTFPAALTKDY